MYCQKWGNGLWPDRNRTGNVYINTGEWLHFNYSSIIELAELIIALAVGRSVCQHRAKKVSTKKRSIKTISWNRRIASLQRSQVHCRPIRICWFLRSRPTVRERIVLFALQASMQDIHMNLIFFLRAVTLCGRASIHKASALLTM